MSSRIETAPTGRARCRGCGTAIAKGDRRVGDSFVSPFADDAETTHWYHPWCAAYKRPEVLLEALLATAANTDADRDRPLEQAARTGLAHRRLPRIDGAERAASGRATCRACRDKIEARGWRIRLVIFDEGRYAPAGFVHARCGPAYFECSDLLGRIRHFSPALDEHETQELQLALAAAT